MKREANSYRHLQLVVKSMAELVKKRKKKKLIYGARHGLKLNILISVRLLEMKSERKTNELQHKRKKTNPHWEHL